MPDIIFFHYFAMIFYYFASPHTDYIVYSLFGFLLIISIHHHYLHFRPAAFTHIIFIEAQRRALR